MNKQINAATAAGNGFGADLVPLPDWNEDQSRIVSRITATRSPLKILLKLKNEGSFLPEWIAHHAGIVGRGNLIIADNKSDQGETLSTLGDATAESVVFTFHGYHNFIHDRERFPELYAALGASCDFYMFMDADERLVWIEDGSWIADSRIVGKLQGANFSKLIPGILFENFALSKDTFYFPRTVDNQLLRWGKPVVPSSLDIPGKHRLHHIQFPSALLPRRGGLNVFSLHLSKLFPEQRLQANKNKLIARGVVDLESSFESIAAMPREKIPNDEYSPHCVNEIRKILRFVSGTEGEPWGPVDRSRSVQLIPDGRITYGSDLARDDFLEFTGSGAGRFAELFADPAADFSVARVENALNVVSTGKIELGIAILRQGMQDFPHQLDQYADPVFHKELIRLLLSLGRWNEAEALIPDQDGPGNPGWHNILFARALDELGRGNDAVVYWRAFAANRPNHGETQQALMRFAAANE